MNPKIVIKMLCVAALVASFLVIGCAEEPTISQVKRPFSVVRVANLTTNLDQIDVKIFTEVDEIDLQVNEVKTISDLGKNEFTEYFDVVSGKRIVQVIEKNNSQVIYEKNIDAPAYAELIWYFSGYYHPNIDSTTFNFFSTQEGITYLDGNVSFGSDSLSIVFLHVSGDTPTDSTKTLRIYSQFTVTGDTAMQDSLYQYTANDTSDRNIVFGEEKRVQAKAGVYDFFIVNSVNKDTLVRFENQVMDATKKSFLYIAGEPSSMYVERKDINPLPARPK